MATKTCGETRRIIAKMLKENTGRSFLDSGDFYGRHWEQNQNRDFDKEPEAWLEVWDGQPIVTINVYHFLIRALEYAPDADKAFQKYADLPENQNAPWLALMEEFPYWYASQFGEDPTGPYGGGQPITVNTYNGEDLLSQVIQYVYFEIDGEGYVILQIHNGCDVRGGYTRPRVFRHDLDWADVTIFDNAHAVIACEGKHNWYTDDGYHWYANGDYKKLTEYQLKNPKKGEPVKCPICGKPLGAYIL